MTARLGWKKDIPDDRDLRLGLLQQRVLPSSIDLRWAMPQWIADQGDTNSCVGQATSALIEHAILRLDADDWIPSASYIYWNARKLDGSLNEDGGCQIRNAIKGLVQYGVCYNEYWPFNPDTIQTEPSPEAYTRAHTSLLSYYKRVNRVPNRVTLNEIKSSLVDGNPVVFGFRVFDQFLSEHCAKTGVVDMPGANDQPIGGHAVVGVGYTDDWRRVICRNSYGNAWGMPEAPGHFSISYDYVTNPDLASDFWMIQGMTNV